MNRGVRRIVLGCAAGLVLAASTWSTATAAIKVGAIFAVTGPASRVRDALEGLRNFAGVGGVFSFSPEDHNGLDIDSFAMMTVKDGRFILYQEQ